MAYRKIIFDEKKIASFIKQGRGSGEGKNYRPWFEVGDVPSIGRSSRPTGWKTGRIHHLLSDHEIRVFNILEWSDSVIDIREQFPLLDRNHSQEIASRLQVKHPIENKTNTPLVLTTDFMITILFGGKKKYIARTVKPSEYLENKRVLEKFEIERIYWEERGIDWGIAEETERSIVLARNIEWVHNTYWTEDFEMQDNVFEEMIKAVLN